MEPSPLIGVMVLVVLARWRWFNSTSAERYLNATLTIILLTQSLREQAVESLIAESSPLTVTMVQQLSLCTIVVSIAPFLCVVDLLSGRDPAKVRRRQFLWYFVAGFLASVILVAGTRARRDEQLLEISGGWDEVLAWVGFSVLPLYLAFQMLRRCYLELRQQRVSDTEKLILAGIAAAGAAIGVSTMIALVLAILQELRVVDSVEFRLRTHSRNFFWIATTISLVSAAPLVKAVIEYLGCDYAGRRLRRLQPLWRAMVSMFPDSRLPLDAGAAAGRGTKLQLHRATVEIRDAILQLRPYCRDVESIEFARFVAGQHVPDHERDMARFALQLADAARARMDNASPANEAVRWRAPSSSATLDDEVAELLALAKWWRAAERFAATRQNRAITESTRRAGEKT